MSHFDTIYQLALTAKTSQELEDSIRKQIPLAVPYNEFERYESIEINGISYFQTPAFRLAYEGNVSAAQLLVDIGAKPAEVLYGLIRSAQYEKAQQFLAKSHFQLVKDVTLPQEKSLNLLIAIINKDMNTLKKMLQDNSYLSLLSSTQFNGIGDVQRNFSMIHVAVRYNVGIEIITMLLKAGVDLESVDVNNRKPATLAGVYKHQELVSLLESPYYRAFSRIACLKHKLPFELKVKIDELLVQTELLKASNEPIEHLIRALDTAHAFLNNQIDLNSYKSYIQTLQREQSSGWKILGVVMMCLGGLALGLGIVAGGAGLAIGVAGGAIFEITGITFFNKKSPFVQTVERLCEVNNNSMPN